MKLLNSGKQPINNKIYLAQDVFKSETITELHKGCEKHFEYNLHKFSSSDHQITLPIIDCHGLHLTESKVYPFCEQHWNCFYSTVREHVKTYIQKTNPELLQRIWNTSFTNRPGYQVYPHSCWAIRIHPHQNEVSYNYDCDPKYPFDKFINAIYCLQNDDIKSGIFLKLKNRKLIVPNEQNSLTIFTDVPYCQAISESSTKIIIQFSFAIFTTNHNVPGYFNTHYIH